MVALAHENRKLIRKMENNEIGFGISNNYCCIRGLEGMTEARKDMVKYNRWKAYDAVLHKQEAHFEDGMDDQELIAKGRNVDQELIAQLYRAVSVHCSIEAAEVGLSDEQAVRSDHF
jgi:hypothetical protein